MVIDYAPSAGSSNGVSSSHRPTPRLLMKLIFAPIWYTSNIGRPTEPSFVEQVMYGVLIHR
jgi:hypothetical protein